MNVGLEGELVGRLILAAVLGAIVGAEREHHDQPAGLRTHLLVAIGSALFTVVSIFGFSGLPGEAAQGTVDPSRIAAGIVTGIGFLGAGAIIRQGAWVRGLTTAASLWTAAAIGLAVGAGQIALGIAATAIVVFALWPLNYVASWLRARGAQEMEIRAELASLAAVGDVTSSLSGGSADIVRVATRPYSDGGCELTVTVRLPAHGHPERLLDELAGLPGVRVVESTRTPGS